MGILANQKLDSTEGFLKVGHSRRDSEIAGECCLAGKGRIAEAFSHGVPAPEGVDTKALRTLSGITRE